MSAVMDDVKHRFDLLPATEAQKGNVRVVEPAGLTGTVHTSSPLLIV